MQAKPTAVSKYRLKFLAKMKSLFGAAVAITIAVNLIITVAGIDPSELLVRELDGGELKFVNETVGPDYHKEINVRPLEESIGTAYIILSDHRYIKLLPTTERSEIIVQITYGNNGRTGLLTLYFLQVLLQKMGRQAYTRVVVFICREQNTETGEEDIEKASPIPLADRMKEFAKIFEAIKSKVPPNGFVVIQQEFGKTGLNYIVNQIHVKLTCANLDCKMGSGQIGKNVHQKMFLSTILDFYLQLFAIPLFGNDIRSGLGALNAGEWLTATYALVSIGRIHSDQYPQGLVITERTNTALTKLQPNGNPTVATQNFKRNPRNGGVVTVAYVSRIPDTVLVFRELESMTTSDDITSQLDSALRAFKVEFFNFSKGCNKGFRPVIQNEIEQAISALVPAA